MARMRAAVMVATTTAMVVTGASLAYVFFTGPPQPPPAPQPEPSPLPAPQPSPPSPLPRGKHHYSPPPDLPLSSKLPSIPNANFDELEPETASQCDYGPLWECIVNGNGGCEVLEEDLRECLERCKNSRSS